MADEHVYRVTMSLPISFDVSASNGEEAKYKVRHLHFKPYSNSVLTPVDDMIVNYAIGFYEMAAVRVQEVSTEQ